MKAWVLLLRGINVGGRNKLAMSELQAIVTYMGGENVATYIQSGNAVFSGDQIEPVTLGRMIETEIKARHGYKPRALVLDADTFRKACDTFPFEEAFDNPKSGHVWFAAETPVDPDLGRLQAVAKPNERFMLDERFFFLHAPDGIGRSKLAERVEGALGVPATARNLNTFMTLCDMLDALEG